MRSRLVNATTAEKLRLVFPPTVSGMSVILIPDHITQITQTLDTNLFEKGVTILFKSNCWWSRFLFDTSIEYSYDIGRISIDIHVSPMEAVSTFVKPKFA